MVKIFVGEENLKVGEPTGHRPISCKSANRECENIRMLALTPLKSTHWELMTSALLLPAPDAEVTITEKTVSVKKEKVTVVGEMETRVVESSPTFSHTLQPITEVWEGEKVT